jgi:hypothetical protein
VIKDTVQFLVLFLIELLEVLETDEYALVVLLHARLQLLYYHLHLIGIGLSEAVGVRLNLLDFLRILHYLAPHHLLLHAQLVSKSL